MRNAPALASIVADPDMLKTMDVPYLADLYKFADDTRKEAEAAGKLIKGLILTHLKDALVEEYAAKGSDTGTVHVIAWGLDFEVNTPKKVEWNQTMLADQYKVIAAAGDDPTEYVKTEYKIDEKAFTAWPAFIKRQFAAARTLTPGNPALVVKEAADEALAA